MEPFDFGNAHFMRYLSAPSPAPQSNDAKAVNKVQASRLQRLFQEYRLPLPTLGTEVDDAIVLSTFALINNVSFFPAKCLQNIETFYTYPDKGLGLRTIEVRLERGLYGVYLTLCQAACPPVIKRLYIPKGAEDVQCVDVLQALFAIINKDYGHQIHKQRFIAGALRATAGNLGDCVLVPRAFAELKESKSLRVIPPLAAIIEEYATPCTFSPRQIRRMEIPGSVGRVLSNTLYHDQLVVRRRARQARKKLRVGD
jgi:hypothetical protein